jgi:DNA-3-methyladenine glycosylase
MSRRLPRSFFTRDAVTVARELLGKRLVRVEDDGSRTSGIILETEAYLGPDDKAAHTYRGRRTPRNQSMYAIGGTAYVYFIYGIHDCLNVVAGRVDQPVAVLLRALHPEEGIERIRERRPAARRDRDLCSGPGKLCAALGISRQLHDGLDLTTSPVLRIEPTTSRGRSTPPLDIVACPRIGVAYAEGWADAPLRFFIKDHPAVSRRT